MPERDTSFNRNGHASAIQRGALNPVTPFKSIIWIRAGERPSTRFESPANLVGEKKKKKKKKKILLVMLERRLLLETVNCDSPLNGHF